MLVPIVESPIFLAKSKAETIIIFVSLQYLLLYFVLLSQPLFLSYFQTSSLFTYFISNIYPSLPLFHTTAQYSWAGILTLWIFTKLPHLYPSWILLSIIFPYIHFFLLLFSTSIQTLLLSYFSILFFLALLYLLSYCLLFQILFSYLPKIHLLSYILILLSPSSLKYFLFKYLLTLLIQAKAKGYSDLSFVFLNNT